MGFIENVRRLFGTWNQGAKNPEYNRFNQAFLWALGGGFTPYDVHGTTYVEDGYNTNSMVYAVVQQMADKASTVPIVLREKADEDAYKSLNRLRKATGFRMNTMQKLRHAALEVKAFSGSEKPLPLEQPNPYQTWTEFEQLFKVFLRLTGNVYMYFRAPEDGVNRGVPNSIYLLPSHLIQIVVKNGVDMLGTENPVKEYMLIHGKATDSFPAENVIHVKYPNPNYSPDGEHLYGQSRLRAALRNIQSSNEGTELNIKTLKSGGAFGFIHGKNTPITEEQAAEIKARLLEMNSSPEDLSKIAGVSAEMGFTRLSLTSDELKPFDYLNFDQKQICNVLGWSDALLNNDDGGKYDKQLQERKRVITDNIVPDLKLFVNALNRHFIPLFKGYENYVLEFDVMELPEMQDDAAELSGIMFNGLDRAVFNRDEVRKALKWPETELPAMQRFTVQSDIISLEEALDSEFGEPNTEPNGD